ncbi:hypothetical protein K504DRAFT_468807 [Pleomassaria siparia CBS 279.74]|uniref:Uncharacterized protein n=1 Tax=Pleomassaria siparia CBS 279.74 TaxID=1314801 RepID=A0A6G1K7G5_9PLEO|nr:hypothetical protein K504DRAFT_468807 [Pleomassaria siparia CBS 279.74]
MATRKPQNTTFTRSSRDIHILVNLCQVNFSRPFKISSATADNQQKPGMPLLKKVTVGEPDKVEAISEGRENAQKCLHKLHRGGATVDADEFEHMPSIPQVSGTSSQSESTPRLTRSRAMYFDRWTTTESSDEFEMNNAQSTNHQTSSLQYGPRQRSNDQVEPRHKLSKQVNKKQRDCSNLRIKEDKLEEGRSVDMASFLQDPSPQQKAKKARYYSWALLEEDKEEALTAGGSKPWTAQDLVRFQDSRMELVPKGLESREAMVEHIEMEQKKARNYLRTANKSVRRFPRLPGFSFEPPLPQSYPPPLMTHYMQVSRSMSDLQVAKKPNMTNNRVSQVPGSPQDLRERTIHARNSSAPDTLFVQPFLTQAPTPTAPRPEPCPKELRERAIQSRNSSSGDYLSRPLSHQPSRPLSQPGIRRSANTNRVRSPLANEFTFQHSPYVTFDSFLEPHTSGKGETYRGSDNAKKEDQPGDEMGSVELEPVDKAKSRLSTCLDKMPSMSSIRHHKTRDDADGPNEE